MAINSAAATGVIDFSAGAAIWLVFLGVLSGGFGFALLASAQPWWRMLRGLPELAGLPMRAAAASRTR
ncbi:MAG: hypothetical protein ABI629_14850 [bacterium]